MPRYIFTDGAGTVRELEAADTSAAMTAAARFELGRSGSLAAAERAAGTIGAATRTPLSELTIVGSDGVRRLTLEGAERLLS